MRDGRKLKEDLRHGRVGEKDEFYEKIIGTGKRVITQLSPDGWWTIYYQVGGKIKTLNAFRHKDNALDVMKTVIAALMFND